MTGSSTVDETIDGAMEAAERGGFIELFLGRSEIGSSENVGPVGDVGALGGRRRLAFLLGMGGKTCSFGLWVI